MEVPSTLQYLNHYSINVKSKPGYQLECELTIKFVNRLRGVM